MSSNVEDTRTLEVPLQHVAEYEKLGVLPMSHKFAESDPHISFLRKPHTLTLLFAALGLLCYLGFSRDDANSVANTKAYVHNVGTWPRKRSITIQCRGRQFCVAAGARLESPGCWHHSGVPFCRLVGVLHGFVLCGMCLK